jgi:hypothetical protein
LVPVALWLVYGTSLCLNPKTSLWSKWRNYSQSKHFTIYALPFFFVRHPLPNFIFFTTSWVATSFLWFYYQFFPLRNTNEGDIASALSTLISSPSLTGTRGAVLWHGLPCQVGWDHTLKWLISMHSALLFFYAKQWKWSLKRIHVNACGAMCL